jgi:uncharacterized protein (TIGR00251 family)
MVQSAILQVRVVPRAGRTALAGMRGDALLVRLAAAPVDGAANEALIEFLAKLFDLAKRDVTIVGGERGRDKRIALAGLTADRLQQKLSDILRS